MELYFNANPQVALNRDENIVQGTAIATNLATVTSLRGYMVIQEENFSDDQVVTVVIADAQAEIVTVFYSLESSVGNEKGTIIVAESASGYGAQVERYSDDEFMEHISFSAAWSGGSLNLVVTGDGSGVATDMRWRTSPFNSLDILPAV